jgi:hypothetical protein
MRKKLSKLLKHIRRRKKQLIKLIVVFVLSIVVLFFTYFKYCQSPVGVWDVAFEMTTMLVSALLSTIIAIYITMDDIMENECAQNKEDFGVLFFEDGYDTIFLNEECKVLLNAKDWPQFFADSTDKKIYIVAVHANGFFENDEYRICLLNLWAENKFELTIILCNPYSNEVLYEAVAEHKSNRKHIKEKILNTYELIQKDIRVIEEKWKKSGRTKEEISDAKSRINILFSETMPKALIFKVGKYMIVSPYMFESPSSAPTLILENSREFAFYDKYTKYIDKLSRMGKNYEQLEKHILATDFFSQPYRNLSQEFYTDFKECKDLSILGLGQKHMFTSLETGFYNILDRKGKIEAILGDPNGNSTEMCVKRSIIHNNVGEAQIEHKLAINKLLIAKNKREEYKSNVHVYIWDCFFPYTLYIFNMSDANDMSNLNTLDNIDISEIRIYVWLTNLFEAGEKRLGFLIDGLTEPEMVKSYLMQYGSVKRSATEVKTSYNVG